VKLDEAEYPLKLDEADDPVNEVEYPVKLKESVNPVKLDKLWFSGRVDVV